MIIFRQKLGGFHYQTATFPRVERACIYAMNFSIVIRYFSIFFHFIRAVNYSGRLVFRIDFFV